MYTEYVNNDNLILIGIATIYKYSVDIFPFLF